MQKVVMSRCTSSLQQVARALQQGFSEEQVPRTTVKQSRKAAKSIRSLTGDSLPVNKISVFHIIRADVMISPT